MLVNPLEFGPVDIVLEATGYSPLASDHSVR